MKNQDTATTPSGLAMSSSDRESASPTAADASPTLATKKSWNTDRLALRLGSDVLSAASAGSLVAPLIAIIDRYGAIIRYDPDPDLR